MRLDLEVVILLEGKVRKVWCRVYINIVLMVG